MPSVNNSSDNLQSTATGWWQNDSESWRNTMSSSTRLLSFFPISLFAFSAAEMYRRIITSFNNSSTPSSISHGTAGVAEEWEKLLKEVMKRCRSACQASVFALCGSMTIFQMVPKGVFQLCMVLNAMICVSALYYIPAIRSFTLSLSQLGMPKGWTDHDEKFCAIFLALPEALTLWLKIFASLCAVYMTIAYGTNPMRVYNLLRGRFFEADEAADSPLVNPNVTPWLPVPPWMYVPIACILAVSVIQCVAVQWRLNMLLRDKTDLEKYGNNAEG